MNGRVCAQHITFRLTHSRTLRTCSTASRSWRTTNDSTRDFYAPQPPRLTHSYPCSQPCLPWMLSRTRQEAFAPGRPSAYRLRHGPPSDPPSLHISQPEPLFTSSSCGYRSHGLGLAPGVLIIGLAPGVLSIVLRAVRSRADPRVNHGQHKDAVPQSHGHQDAPHLRVDRWRGR